MTHSYRSAALTLAVLLAGCHAATAPAPTVPVLSYDRDAGAAPLPFRWSAATDPYLVDFDQRYAVSGLVAQTTTDLERVQSVSKWVHGRFAHDGSHAASSSDPTGILVAAATGQRFRCVEYAIVTSGALNALGIPARVVWLLLEDTPTRTDGLAHVVAEAYLRDANRWVMVDAQWDVVPTSGGQPVSALQLQQALANRDTTVLALSRSGTTTKQYSAWIAEYLYYFYTPIDARVGVNRSPGAAILSPIGDTRLTVKYPAPANTYTHAIAAFYPALRP